MKTRVFYLVSVFYLENTLVNPSYPFIFKYVFIIRRTLIILNLVKVKSNLCGKYRTKTSTIRTIKG